MAEKTKKTKKAPGFYRKFLNIKTLEKKYLKYLEIDSDKEFIRGCYEEKEEGLYIRRDLSVDEAKRLKTLASDIKKNRKWVVNILPLGIAAAVIAGLVVFFMIIANPLLQKALETGLEAIFEARVNANNFRISLIRFEIGMSSLTIADRDQPMKNLIQFGRMNIKLRPEAVLRGKIYIEEIRADNLRFGTDRSVSGALPGRPPRERAPRPEITIPPLVDLQNFDPMALLNQEYDKLQTPKLYEAANEAYKASVVKWKGEEEAARARVAELRSRAEPLLRINMNDFRTLDAATVERIRTIIADINAMVTTVQAAQDDVTRIFTGVQEDVNTARALEQNARNALTNDLNHLLSYLDLGSGAAMEILEPLVLSILTDSAQTYLAYGLRALEALEKVKSMQEMLPKSSPKPPGERNEKFRGRDVVFPVWQYPRFYMGTLATDVLTPSNWRWAFDLRGVSSDPDLSGVPSTLSLSLAEAGDGLRRSGAFNGRADFRSNARERFNAEISGDGFPVSISLARVGIGSFSGGASFGINASGNSGGGFSAGGNISFVQARLTEPSNTFAQAADEAIRQVNSVDLGISIGDRFSVTTNLGEIIRAALGRIVAQYRRQAEEQIERVFRAKIEEFIGEGLMDRQELDLIFQAIRGDMNAVAELRNTLENMRNELENRIRSAAEDAARQAADEARQQGQQAVQDALDRANIPRLPGILGR